MLYSMTKIKSLVFMREYCRPYILTINKETPCYESCFNEPLDKDGSFSIHQKMSKV